MTINGVKVQTRILEGPGHLNFLTHRGEVKAVPGDVIITFPGDIHFVCPGKLFKQLEENPQVVLEVDEEGRVSEMPLSIPVVGLEPSTTSKPEALKLSIEEIKAKSARGEKLTAEEELAIL